MEEEQRLRSEWVESDLGQGATFHFAFPFATKEQLAAADD
jgi:signal transduction histidine kinase